LIFQATEKFADGKKLMSKDNKTPSDYERAIQLFSEAIALLQNTTNQTEASYAKFYAARGNAFMQTGQYQRALYDFSAAVRFEEANASHYGTTRDLSYKFRIQRKLSSATEPN
jgi:tetratricopeptide (TPR) repeat protein